MHAISLLLANEAYYLILSYYFLVSRSMKNHVLKVAFEPLLLTTNRRFKDVVNHHGKEHLPQIV
jgi:hypothetical protein